MQEDSVQAGITGEPAPELGVTQWIDAAGQPLADPHDLIQSIRRFRQGPVPEAATPGEAESPVEELVAPAVEEPAAPAATPAKPASTAKAKPAVFPKAVATKYNDLTAGKARLKTCADQYNANKATNANGELKWIAKGGGYWSQCNAKLKG